MRPRCGAKHFQAAYMKALANSGDAGTVLGDGGAHGGILGTVFKSAPTAPMNARQMLVLNHLLDGM